MFVSVALFGGGIIGAYMGALPVFILTDVIAIIGSMAAMAGGADMTVGFIVLGSYLGPHIVSAGGAAASVHTGRTKKPGNGTGILSRLNGLADPATLLVGSVFGVTGFLTHYLTGMVLHLNTGPPGLTVTLSVAIARLVFNSGGLIGKAVSGESREYFINSRGMLCNVILGLGLGTTTSFVYQAFLDSGASVVAVGSYPVLCLGIAAVPLIFAQTGFAMPATYHIALISALTAVSSQNPVMDIVFGILTILLGDFVGKTFSSCYDTRIDPPAFTISAFTSIVNIMLGGGFFSV